LPLFFLPSFSSAILACLCAMIWSPLPGTTPVFVRAAGARQQSRPPAVLALASTANALGALLCMVLPFAVLTLPCCLGS
jgi:hypothetical protein